MTKEREALRMALDTLISYRTAIKKYGYAFERGEVAITAIKEALAQPEQGQGIKGYAMALNEVSLKLRKRYEQDLIATPLWAEFEKARNRLARSVAQPEQQAPSVGAEVISAQDAVYNVCLEKWGAKNGVTIDAMSVLNFLKVQQEQGPVACQYAVDVAMPEYRCVGKCQYISPPRREWVGLTVEQIEDVGFNLLPTVTRKDFVAFARYVEMLSKELNT